MMKASSGTAGVLGLSNIRMNTPPTTAYFMIGEKCSNNCKFCSQSRDSNSENKYLSRVDWIPFEDSRIISSLDSAFKCGKLKRACLQVVHTPDYLSNTITAISTIRHASDIPICSSAALSSLDEIQKIINAGADKVCIAIDGASSDIYTSIKGSSSFNSKLELLTNAATNFPGKITVHLIVGLGETEQEMITLISHIISLNVTVALFAFTPIKGTQMENHPQPLLSSYRKVQVCKYFIEQKLLGLDDLVFDNGVLISVDMPFQKFEKQVLDSSGLLFMTSGCPDCNRPYYNERPGGVLYNYPYSPSKQEILNCIAECELQFSK